MTFDAEIANRTPAQPKVDLVRPPQEETGESDKLPVRTTRDPFEKMKSGKFAGRTKPVIVYAGDPSQEIGAERLQDRFRVTFTEDPSRIHSMRFIHVKFLGPSVKNEAGERAYQELVDKNRGRWFWMRPSDIGHGERTSRKVSRR